MDPLQLLNEKITNFPGYGGEDERRLSEEMVRSYMGEALADLQVRLSPLDAAMTERVGDLLFRAGFTNQSAFRAYDNATVAESVVAAVAKSDAHLIEIADKAPGIDAAGLGAYLDEIRTSFDMRDAAMKSIPTADPAAAAPAAAVRDSAPAG
jgi:hypothetical protein